MGSSLLWLPLLLDVPLWSTGEPVSLDVSSYRNRQCIDHCSTRISTTHAVIAVLLYHGGCYLEYKLGIKDTARVVPVHGVWSVA